MLGVNLLHNAFSLLINAPTYFELKLLAIFRELVNVLRCAAYVSTCMIGILHLIKIIVMRIKISIVD